MEKVCRAALRAVEKLLTPLGLAPHALEEMEIDPYGPRILLTLAPPWAKKLAIDASPDGVEATLTLPAPPNLDPDEAEAALEEATLEEAPEAEDYETAYDPEEGEAIITIHAQKITHLPNLEKLAKTATQKLQQLQQETQNHKQ